MKNNMDKEKFLALAAKKYEHINALTDKLTMMDYEKGLVEIMQELGREVAQSQLGDQAQDRRKKRGTNPPSGQSK
ncbi:hypothetical protein [Phaeodactylibacter luteus]|uniref:Uncharacterized protein n=1 Tax=Phaeodactylibacter luteus TaxID=1564516 RepID=A0A5C6RGW4_9BACT|nr:hypothetical protein [Phaeodactylibacter luteus]TXB54411.1 hypothetical protein FRY97_21995 [Phaeodactylibacter luteus]